MTFRPRIPTRLVAVPLVISTLAGCVEHLPPPPRPPQTEPAVEEKQPPSGGQARVVLDAEGESAWVSRVTGTTSVNGAVTDGPGALRPKDGTERLGLLRTDELLCVTPCAVDLRAGAHSFVFSREGEKGRQSVATVVVPSDRTTFVRHSIGHTPYFSSPYVGGAFLFLLGSGFTLLGGAATIAGATINGVDEKGQPVDGSAFLTIGLVTLGIGVVTGAVGLGMLLHNRPTEQPGATTQWTRP
jgi:hypothetical protein